MLISFGPIAIRWYALAYIVGILLGWLYARTIIKREKLWGGAPPMTPADYDDFVLWVTLGIILGGRIGYVLFYNPAYFAAAPAGDASSCGRAACPSTAAFSAACLRWCCSRAIAAYPSSRLEI